MPAIRAPWSKQTATLLVAVKCRGLSEAERHRSRHIIQVTDERVQSADKILELLNLDNSRRKTESTEANATSSRSHAVLEITVKRKQNKEYRSQILREKLALVDLSGSDRASETNNEGQELRDGGNISRSLLALANCINTLGKQ